MKLKQRRAFNALIERAMPGIIGFMEKHNVPDPEDAAQSVVLDMCIHAERDASLSDPNAFWYDLGAYCESLALSLRGSPDKTDYVDLWHARNVVEPHTPHNVLIAAEVADKADSWGIMPVVMGDTLSEEAEYFNMSRQRIHQMVNQARDALSEYLIIHD